MIGIFLVFFALYAHTCGPHLVPYRDAGEMASLLGTLGVAHPPGYPLYTLLGRWSMWLPLGNMVYRANIFSATCAALALGFFYLTLRTWLDRRSSFLAACFLGFSNPFWELANVPEMYTLGVLWLCLLFYSTFRLKNPFLWAFLMTLGLGVRMDLMLLIPIFLAWFFLTRQSVEKITTAWVGFLALFGTLGFSLFLYLMIRSRTNPAMDWGNPDTLLAVFNSARRKSYSGTLDLLSLSYQSGENFLITLRLYGQHLSETFGWWGIVLAIFGWGVLWKKEKRVALFCGAIFCVMGPLFFYLANMPPNPHALAIVEASYLVPDVMMAFSIAWSIAWIMSQKGTIISTVVFSGLLAMNAFHGYARASKRNNYYAHDYVENIWRSTPRNSIAVFHKDVQLFSLWASQLLDKRRPDVSLMSTGLSASPWYWEMKKRWKTASSPEISLKEPGGWKRLVTESGGRPVIVGYDVELNDRVGLNIQPQGLAIALTPNSISPDILTKLCLYRGRYVYGETPDFFSTDLVGDHARAHHQYGFYALMHNQPDMANWFFRRSESLDPTFSRASSDRGYVNFVRGNFLEAYNCNKTAVRKAAHALELTSTYKSLPEVKAGYRQDLSNAYTQLGATAEKIQRMQEARDCYTSSLKIQENAQAHYNLAVTYWGTDWAQVIQHMGRALELNPQMSEARIYLAKAQMLAGHR